MVEEKDTIMAAISYVLFSITGIVVYLVEKEDKFVRFHAVQSMIAGIVLFVVWMILGIVVIILGIIPIIGWILDILISGGFLILSVLLWLLLMYKAYSGEEYKLPVLGKIAEKNI